MSEVAVATGPDTAADFDGFVAARGSALWRSAWLLTGDRHRAEDLVQTALGKAWPHWDRVARSGSFEAYVRKTMFTTYGKVEQPQVEPVAHRLAAHRRHPHGRGAAPDRAAQSVAALGQGQPDGSVERYVRRTLVTTCTDRWRRRWRGEIATARLPDPTSHRRCGSRRPRHDVMAARDRLTRGQRAAVVVRYFDDLTDADGRGTRLQCRYGEKPDVACHGGLALLADASAG